MRDRGVHLRGEAAGALADPPGDIDVGPLAVDGAGEGDDEVFEDGLFGGFSGGHGWAWGGGECFW